MRRLSTFGIIATSSVLALSNTAVPVFARGSTPLPLTPETLIAAHSAEITGGMIVPLLLLILILGLVWE